MTIMTAIKKTSIALRGSVITTAVIYAPISKTAPMMPRSGLAFGGFSPRFSLLIKVTALAPIIWRTELMKRSRKMTAKTPTVSNIAVGETWKT